MLLKKGSRGPDVRELQEALGLAADGIFGSGTEAAVKEFQKENDLSVDGLFRWG
jgi:peptidoglycan hydrolase-like protein with peptidoglycan-binding domain